MFPMDSTIRKIAKEALSVYWPKFVLNVSIRLHRGKSSYGDNSFACPPRKTLREIREELQDVAGWAFVLDCQLEAMEQRLLELDEANKQAVQTLHELNRKIVMSSTV